MLTLNQKTNKIMTLNKNHLGTYAFLGLVLSGIGYFAWKKYKTKTCKKWSENVCITAPCPQTCLEY